MHVLTTSLREMRRCSSHSTVISRTKAIDPVRAVDAMSWEPAGGPPASRTRWKSVRIPSAIGAGDLPGSVAMGRSVRDDHQGDVGLVEAPMGLELVRHLVADRHGASPSDISSADSRSCARFRDRGEEVAFRRGNSDKISWLCVGMGAAGDVLHRDVLIGALAEDPSPTPISSSRRCSGVSPPPGGTRPHSVDAHG